MECRRTNRPIKPEKSEFNEYLCPTEEYRPSRLFQLASVKLKEMVYVCNCVHVKCKM
jgi:hypothetical protein